MKKKWLRLLAFCCGMGVLFSVSGGIASATELQTDFPGVKIPTPSGYTWSPLVEATGADRNEKYFVIHAKTQANDKTYNEDLYISFPAEGGFRLQTLHEFQKDANGKKLTAPETSVAGLFEPSSIAKIQYKTDGSAIVMTGSDGTTVRYAAKGKGFELQVRNPGGKHIVSLTEKQISFAYSRNGNIARTMVELPLTDREAIYGGGQRFGAANLVGKTFSLTNVDCWSQPEYSYKNVPIFHSNRGYSIWFNMAYAGKADIGDTNKNKYSVTFDGSKLDFYLWQGMPLDNIKKYTGITGTSGVSNTWTYGFWTGASYQAFSQTRLGNAVDNLKELIEGYKDNYNFYPDACFAEGLLARTNTAVSYLHQRNVRTIGWFSPDLYADFGSFIDYLPSNSEYPVFDKSGKLLDAGYPRSYDTNFLKYYGIRKFTNNKYLDFSNPNALEIIRGTWAQYWDWGVCGAMNDFGEWYPFTGTYFNGLDGTEMHNLMAYYYAKAINEAWTKQFKNDYVSFMRSGYAGSQYYSGDFLGDNHSDYSLQGLTGVVHAMISMGASGFNLYGADLGGYGGHASNDLWNRWVTLSVFSPYMRQHGLEIHMPWEQGMMGKKAFGGYYYFRKNIVPTVESAAISAEKTSNPMVKGMMVAYPYQLSLAQNDTQYLFCDDFLVCPVTEENAYFWNVSLPKGATWYDLSTYKAYQGGQTIAAEAPASSFPVYVQGGAVKPIQLPESMQLGAEMHDESKDEYQAIDSLLITPPDNSRTTTFYNKVGDSEDYHTYNCTTETYINARSGDSSFTVTNNAGSGRQIVLALGVTASSVTADGKTLTRLDHVPDYFNEEYGYYVDISGMTTIYLPKNWKSLSVVKGSSGYVSYKMTGVGNEATLKNMFDGNVKTSHPLPQLNSAYTTVKMNETAEVGRLVIKWTVGFSNSYDVEYSEDGNSWHLLLQDEKAQHTVTDGAGSYDVIDFEPVKAAYFRLRTIERGDGNAAPAIYSLEAFAPDKFVQLTPAPDDSNNWDDWNGDEYDEPWDDWNNDTEEPAEDNIDQEEPGDDNNGDAQQSGGKRKKIIITSYFPTWAIVLIIVGGVAVAGGTVFLVLYLKKKKKAGIPLISSEAGTLSGDLDDFPKKE